MKKVLFVALSMLVCSNAFAGLQIFQDDAEQGHVAQMNCSTGVTCTKSGDRVTVVSGGSPVITGGTINNAVIGGSTPAAGTFTTLTGSSVIASQYVRAMYYNKNTRPASGAPVGSIITMGNSGDGCGLINGTVFTVCVSNGTDWIKI